MLGALRFAGGSAHRPGLLRKIYDVLPPLLGAAKARLGASSSRMRQWVESEPCGRSPLPPPPHINLECPQQPYQAPDSLWRPPQHTPKSAPRTPIGSKMPESFAPVHRNAIFPPRARNSLENNAPTRARDPTAKNTGLGGWGLGLGRGWGHELEELQHL